MTCFPFRSGLMAIFLCSSLSAIAQQGTLDPSFATGGMYTKDAQYRHRDFRSVTIQPDNKILVGSQKVDDSLGPYWVYSLSRFNSNGTPDLSFGKNGVKVFNGINGSAGTIREMFVHNNRIILAGTSSVTTEQFQLIGLNMDGSIDAGYGDGPVPGFSKSPHTSPISYGQTYCAADMAYDGSVYIAGYMHGNGKSNVIIAKYKANGLLDSSWQTNGLMSFMPNNNSTQPRDIKVLHNGKILLTGSYNPQTAAMGMFLAQFNHDGTPDNSFGTNGFLNTSDASGVIQDPVGINIDADNSILLAANTYEYPPYTIYTGPYLTKYTSNGTLVTGFGNGGKSQPQLVWQQAKFQSFASVIQPDHKIVIAGTASVVDSTRFFISRFLPSGNLDSSFGTNGTALLATTLGTGFNHTVRALALQADGKIVAAGDAGNTNNTRLAVLMRLNSTFVHVEKIAAQQLTLYPNPVENQLHLEGLKADARYSILNSVGSLVQQGTLSAAKASIDVSSFGTGIYLLQVATQEGGSVSFKLIKR